MDVDADVSTQGEKVAVGAAALTALAAFLPWVTAGFISVNGIDGDGAFTLLFAAVVAGIALVRKWERVDRIAVGALGGLTIAVAAVTYNNLGNQSGAIDAAAGIGLHLTVIGGIAMIAAAVIDQIVD